MRLALLLACVASLSACDSVLDADDPLTLAAPQTASLRVPLTAHSDEGMVFRLRDVQIDISGSALLRLSDRDGVRGRETLLTDLPAGTYTAFVQPGWRLMQREVSGSETQAEAELLSQNPLLIQVGESGDVTLRLVFKQGDAELQLGNALPVRITQTSAPSAQRSRTTL